MRRAHIALLAFALVIGTVRSGQANEADDNDVSRMTGTYWISIEAGFPTPLPGLLAFTADGRIVAVEGQGPETSGLGSWERRGSRRIAGVFIFFLALSPGTGPDGGRYSLMGRVDFTGQFDEHLESAKLPFTISIFSVGQNPLVDTPLFSVPGEMTAARLDVRGR